MGKLNWSDVLDLVLERLADNRRLPITLHLSKCPNHKPTCRKRHNDVKIEKFIREKNLFICTFYGMHNSIPVFEKQEQKPEFVRNYIQTAIKREIYTQKKLLNITNIDIKKSKRITFRLSDIENDKVNKLAKKQKLSVTDFIRKKILG